MDHDSASIHDQAMLKLSVSVTATRASFVAHAEEAFRNCFRKLIERWSFLLMSK